MKKLLALALVMVFIVGLLGGVALAENEECVRYGQGYWKQWLAEQDDEWSCSMGFSAKELLNMLNTPARGDATQILLYQFIAASLNVNVIPCEPPPAVAEALGASGEHLQNVLEGGEGTGTRQEILGWKDILEFWNENEYAELLSVVYEGEGDLFGNYIDDIIIFTFSNDVFHDPNVEVTFESAQRLWEGWGADNWILEGNTATVTLNRVYGSPRDIVDDKVMDITGLIDAIGNTVVVPVGGIMVTQQ